MMGFGNMKMFLSLGILYFLLDNGLGAPPRGRYMWLKCHPNGLDPNCEKQKGPVMHISGLPDKLPAAALKHLMNENSALDLEAAKEQRMEKQEEQDEEVYEADPEEQEDGEVYEADPEEQEEEQDGEVYEADPEEHEEQDGEVYEADPEEHEEQDGEVYEADPEEQEEEKEEEKEQTESVPEVMEPEERPAEEGSAGGPFLNEEGSGEQWADSSSSALPEEVLTGPAMPPVQEMREEHLIL